ncbi:SUZ RNA-binding domain-containing-like isoform X2 [Festucalex cinctus]
MEDDEVAESWEEAADSGEIERRLEAKLKINQQAKKTSSSSPQMKSLAQREAEYAEARRRILGSASSDDTPQENPGQERPVRMNAQPPEPVRPNNHVIRQPTGPDGTSGFRLGR